MKVSMPCSPLPGVVTPLQEVFGKYDQPGRQLPVITDSEIDHLQSAVEIALDPASVLGHVYVQVA